MYNISFRICNRYLFQILVILGETELRKIGIVCNHYSNSQIFVSRIIALSLTTLTFQDDLNETSALLASSNLHFAGATDRHFTGRKTLEESEGNLAARDENSATHDGCCPALIDSMSTQWDGIGTYWNHSAVGAGLALALLQFSVIRFDNIVVGAFIPHYILQVYYIL